MKFTDFLNETPLEVVLNNDDSVLKIKAKRLKEKEPKRSERYKDFVINTYDSPFDGNEEIIVKDVDDNVVLYLSQYIEKIKGKMLIKNAYVNKSRSIESSSIIDILFHLNEKYDGMISDDTQSVGGKKLWKKLLETAISKGYKIGVYDVPTKTISFKDEKLSFNLWYTLKQREIYSTSDMMSTNYRLVIIK